MTIKAFVSYSHKDKKMLEEFKTFFTPVLNYGSIDLWDDTKILTSADWEAEIQTVLNSVDIAILFVSANYLASSFIVKKELQPLLDKANEGGVKISWILLSDCLYQDSGIAKYQAAHEISKTIDSLKKSKRSSEWTNICKSLLNLVVSEASGRISKEEKNENETFLVNKEDVYAEEISSEIKRRKITSGTKEWADHNVNLIDGCSHDCRYCYAKKMAIRFKRKTEDSWRIMSVRDHDVQKARRKMIGRVMFPTSHDIIPEEPCFSACMTVLEKLLKAGNSVLVTTKPHLKVVTYICENFKKYIDKIQFRFTITSIEDTKLAYWEPGAPKFQERLASLKFAFREGYKTSISIEPCLDPDPRPLVETLRPYVTESIWLGVMNYSGKHDFTSKEALEQWIQWLQDDPLIRFKDSVEKHLGC